MSGSKAVVGVFTYLDDTLKAIKAMKESNHDIKAFAPFACPELSEAIEPKRSPVRFVTGTGAVTGLTFGFSLAILCSLDWPLRVSAKNVISVPAFVPIGYECTILFGGIFTLLALLHFCKIPDILRKIGHDPRFTYDKFGLVVACDGAEVDDVKSQLKKLGADEVEVRDGL